MDSGQGMWELLVAEDSASFNVTSILFNKEVRWTQIVK